MAVTAAAMQPKLTQFGRAPVERRDQMPVLDVVAERLEPDLSRLERHFRRTQQAAVCRR